MKDKLTFKHKRVQWTVVLDLYCNELDKKHYIFYYRRHCKRIHSADRIAYNFLLHLYGRKWIKSIRDNPDLIKTREELVHIAKTEWIKKYELF